MLIQYTPISSLTTEQQARLLAQVTATQLEGVGHIVFEGFAISTSDLRAHVARHEQKPPPKQLNG